MEPLTQPIFPTDRPTPFARGAWWPVAVWLAAFVTLLPFVFTSHFGVDEFQFLTEARRISEGAVIYRDFFEFIMPGSFLLLGAWFKLVGPSLLAARLLQAAVLALLATALWAIGRAMGLGRWLALGAPLVLLAVLVPRSFFFSHHWFAQAGVGLTLGLAWWTLGRRGAASWAAVGAAVGITYTMQQLDGAALLAGIGLGALWAAWRQGWGLSATARRAGWFLAGALAPLMLLALYFATHGALGDAIWATHVWSLTQYRAAGNHNDIAYATNLPNEISTMVGWLSRPHWYAGLLIAVVGTTLPLVLLIAGVAWLAGRSRATGPADRREAMTALLVAVTGMLFLAATRGRADLTHLMHAQPAHYLLVALAIAGWERQMATWPQAIGLRWLPRAALIGLVLAGGLRVAETARHAPEQWLRLSSPDTRIRQSEAISAIAGAVTPGDTLACVPIGAFYYFYVAPNATRFHYWVRPEDGYTTPAQHREILGDILSRKPRFVLVVTPLGRQAADAYVHELAVAYRFERTLPYPTQEPGVDFVIYAYQLRP